MIAGNIRGKTRTLPLAVSVSYTHLDVYKRQKENLQKKPEAKYKSKHLKTKI